MKLMTVYLQGRTLRRPKMYLLFQRHAYLSINPCSGPHSRHGNPPPRLWMFRFSRSAAVTAQPWQSRQIGGQLSGPGDTGDDTRGQTKLAHQRDEPSPQAISRSALQWIGSPTGRALGSGQASRLSQMGRIGGRGDVPASLVFPLTKDSRAARRFVLADFTALKNTTSLTFSCMFH